MAAPDPPFATYRLQLGPDVGFAEVAGLLDYLPALGVSHVYVSPVLQARRGSTHGYDVADPTRVATELGGEQGLRDLAAAAHERGVGLVVDVVPNHMGAGEDNPLWEELLAEGRPGQAGAVFDVEWAHPLPGAENKVVLAVLGSPYGEVLHAGQLRVEEADGRLRVHYHERSFPLSAASAEAVERAGGISALRGVPGEPETWGRLHALLERQHYRLVHWRAGDALLNYRRFFTIDDLPAVRVEDPVVFDRTHAAVLDLTDEGVVDGLRIDHPDGLRDPARYLQRLADATEGAWIVVEKILHPGEQLPQWPVAGTTGYEFCNDVLGLYVDPDGLATLGSAGGDFGTDEFAAVARRAKREVLDGGLAPDLRRLGRLLWRLLQQHLEVRDVGFEACVAALAGMLVGLDVYRTYTDPETGTAREADVDRLRLAVERAAADLAAPPSLLEFLFALLTGDAGTSPAHLDVVARFQQLSGAVMAKGVEDTAFYRHRRLLALNEVGGDPDRPGLTTEAFHDTNRHRAERQGAGMVTTATHDTKRGEDVRLRIAALSELAVEWAAAVRQWREWNAAHITDTPAGPAPDPATEYLIYQTLVGVWPLEAPTRHLADVTERVVAYTRKACREAAERTSWHDPDEGFEAGVERFVTALLDPAVAVDFVASLAEMAGQAAEIAMVAGLAQTLLRCTAPGVPDTYQGTELWDDSLVDPDNRRPVDFDRRRRLLAELDAGADPAALWAARRDGRVKLWVLSRALRARSSHPETFGPAGAYQPLAATGRWADHVVAYARRAPDGAAAVVIAPRLPGRLLGAVGGVLGDAWADTAVALPPGRRAWTNRLTGTTLAADGRPELADVLTTLPVALLVSAGS